MIELTKRVRLVFPNADFHLKSVMSFPTIKTDTSDHEKEWISAATQEMFGDTIK